MLPKQPHILTSVQKWNYNKTFFFCNKQYNITTFNNRQNNTIDRTTDTDIQTDDGWIDRQKQTMENVVIKIE